MKIKKIILPILAFLCMAIIFFFSNQNANKSINLSDEVARKTVEIKSEVIKTEITEREKENFVASTRILIRKSAHFIIYFILGILLYLTFKSYNVKHLVLYSIFICFLYACSDEVHQLFVSERTAKVLDVFIDTCGATLGIGLVYLLKNIKVKRIS